MDAEKLVRVPRESNMELLRIVAMLLILISHANFVPSIDEYKINPCSAFTRELIECIAVIAVNCFIFISGWFRIRPTLKGLSKFVFQCLFFVMGIYAVKTVVGGGFNFRHFIECLFLTNNWFYPAYLGLFVLSPVLNAFIEKSTLRQLWIVVICFYVFQSIYGAVFSIKWIGRGYSTFSFIGLYILASSVRRSILEYKIKFCNVYLLLAFWGISLIRVAIQFLGRKYDIGFINPYVYDTPLLVLCTVLFCVYFSRLNIGYSKVINWVAASAFAAFLFHMNLFDELYRPIMSNLYSNYSGVICMGVMFGAILCFFVIAILLDQPRKLIWNWISKNVWK